MSKVNQSDESAGDFEMDVVRHSLSHILASAVKRLFPTAKLCAARFESAAGAACALPDNPTSTTKKAATTCELRMRINRDSRNEVPARSAFPWAPRLRARDHGLLAVARSA